MFRDICKSTIEFKYTIKVKLIWDSILNVAINLGVQSPILLPSYLVMRCILDFGGVEPIQSDPFEVGLISQCASSPHGEVMCQIV